MGIPIHILFFIVFLTLVSSIFIFLVFMRTKLKTSNLLENSCHLHFPLSTSNVENLRKDFFFTIIYCIIRAWPIFITKKCILDDILFINKFRIDNDYNSSSEICRLGV